MAREFRYFTLIMMAALLCRAIPAPAQTKLSLGQAVRQAVEGSIPLRAQRLDTAAALADVITAGLRPNPALQINADLFSSSMPIVTPEAKQYGLSLSMPIETGGKREARIALAEKNAALARTALGGAEQQAGLAAASAWFDLAQAKLSREIIARAHGIFDSLAAINRVRLRDQVITPAELTRSQIVAEQYALLEKDADLQVAKAQRALALATFSTEPVDIDDSLPHLELPPLDSLLALAYARRGDLAAARAGIEVASANQSLQEANALADFTVSADYLRQQGVPFYGFSVNVPLPFFSRNQGEREKSAVLRAQAELNYDAARRRVEGEIRTAYDEYTSRRESLDRFDGLLRSAEKVRSTVEYAYRTGNTTILDFLDAQRTWFETRQAYDDAKINYERSSAMLAMAGGLDPL